MTKKKIVPVDYTSRDFNSIKADLVMYASRYYPNVYKDFNEASFGSLLLDTVAYVGDMLSFYLDYSVNESFMETALEHDNIVSHARTMGYKYNTVNTSHGECQFYAQVPVLANSSAPDVRYIPKLLKGSTVSTPGGTIFTLVEDVEFNNPDNEITVASVDENNMPAYYVIKASGTVMSGDLVETIISVGPFSRFLRVEIPGSQISEIVSVFDAAGNEYFEVPYLSQNVIYKSIPNYGKDKDTTPNIIKSIPAPRRFVVEQFKDKTYLQFGYGSETELSKSNAFADPSELALQIHGKDYVVDSTFDPAKLMSTEKFGVVPSNVDLFVTYRVNTTENVNAGSHTLIVPEDKRIFFRDSDSLDANIKSYISDNLESSNEEPIVGDVTMPTTEEIKRRALGVFATQDRAVTSQDYIACAYSMPSEFGAIKRCAVYRDPDDLKRNINMYVVSEGPTGKLLTTNTTMKENLKNWLNTKRMISDTVDILDARIINIGINFEVIAQDEENVFQILQAARSKITEDLLKINPEIGESFFISDVFKSLKDLPGVLDVVNVKLINRSGGDYSEFGYSIDSNMSHDGRVLRIPQDAIWEVKLPLSDISGVIR